MLKGIYQYYTIRNIKPLNKGQNPRINTSVWPDVIAVYRASIFRIFFRLSCPTPRYVIKFFIFVMCGMNCFKFAVTTSCFTEIVPQLPLLLVGHSIHINCICRFVWVSKIAGRKQGQSGQDYLELELNVK